MQIPNYEFRMPLTRYGILNLNRLRYRIKLQDLQLTNYNRIVNLHEVY